MNQNERLWEVDFLRGVAVLMMLVSNFIFDLGIFTPFLLSESIFWPCFARSTAGLFLLLVGVSLTLSLSRPAARRLGFLKVLKRGAMTFALGLVITLATWLAVGTDLVVFGILHLIGLGVILAYPFLRHGRISLFAGLSCIAAGWLLRETVVSFPWLVWLGVQFEGFSSVDYTPVFPWFGLILIGVFLGGLLFPGGQRALAVPPMENVVPVRWVRTLGNHSLLIYFLHQPIIWAGFWGWMALG